MKALNIFKNHVILSLLAAGMMVSCSNIDHLFEKPQSTPLFVYFNPLSVDMDVESLMPYFVNYSTDLEKMGLRGHPQSVNNEYNDAAWGITYGSYFIFHPNGCFAEKRSTAFSVGVTGFNVWTHEYDDDFKLTSIKYERASRHKNQEIDNGFIYNSAGKLIQREKGYCRNNKPTYLFEYHENGVLKSVYPLRENQLLCESGVTLDKLEFDSLAHLVRLETPMSSNILLEELNKYKRGKSVITYSYSGNLCTKAVERIPVEFDRGIDTLTCENTFYYNSHGDLTSWTYSGGVYRSEGNSWGISDMTFTVKYEYEYDDKGNWTQAKIIFPSNLDEIPALRTRYMASKQGLTSNRDHTPSVSNGETAIHLFKRNINYYNDEVVESINNTKPDENK